jgi:general secretion pathway protein G
MAVAVPPADSGEPRTDNAFGFDNGLTLVELIITISILSILATAALPTAKYAVKRQKEAELRYDLLTMRSAIDHYKAAADLGGIETKQDSYNYPPDLQTLVDGVDVGTTEKKKVQFLRAIPIDPMTGNNQWDIRSMQDDPQDTGGGGGENVFDVHSKSTHTGLDGTAYNTW